MKKQRIILVGPGGSGKDYLARLLEAEGYKKAVSCTTRPMRMGETDGVEYHFTNEDDFRRRIANDEFREWYSFGTYNWLYGTLEVDFQKADLFIMSPPVLPTLGDELKDFVVVYLNIPESVRRTRLELRADADSVDRRLQTDADDFRNFSAFNVEVTDPNFSIAAVMHAIRAS